MDALAQIAQIKVIPRKEIYEPQPAKFIEKKVALKKGGKKVVYAEKINDVFKPYDFRYWYDEKLDRITPLATETFTSEGFTPVLLGSSATWGVKELGKIRQYALAEKIYEGKRYVISTLDLRQENPVVRRFIDFMNRKVEK